jgi:hypothetical protein
MRFRHSFSVSQMFVRLLALLLLMLSVCLPAWSTASTAAAQSEKILVVSGSDVPGKLEEDVAEALDNVGSVISSAGYTGNLRARRQAPDSEEALTKLAPQMGASLIVVLGVSRNKLDVAFRNGHTGRVIDEESVPARGKRPKLAPPARRKIASAAKRALAKVGPAPSSSPAASERSSPQETPTRAPSRPTAPARPVRPQPQPQPQPEEEEEEEGETDAEEQAPAADDKPKAGSDAGISFHLSIGGGVGSRSILVPTSPSRLGGNGIDTSLSPALDVSAMLQFAVGEKLVLRVGGAYRTLFAMNAAYFDAASLPAQSSLSSHSVVVGGSLGFLTNGPDTLGLHLFLGWAYRSLTAAVETLPSASIQGPALRPELHIPIGGGVVTLRIAPELILIVGATAKLPANVPGLSTVGFGFGGEVTLDIRISKAFGLGIQFRESRALIASDWGTSATENERYITGRLNLRF